MDDIDRGQERDQQFLERALAAHVTNRIAGISATHCEECEEPIPEARRQAVPGCTRCITCQTAFENHPRWRTT